MIMSNFSTFNIKESSGNVSNTVNQDIGKTYFIPTAKNLNSQLNQKFIRTGLTYVQNNYPQLFSSIGHTGGTFYPTSFPIPHPFLSTVNGGYFAAGPTPGGLLYIASGGLYKYGIRSTSWQIHPTVPPGVVRYLNGIFLCGTNSGQIYTSTDGFKWTLRHTASAGINGFEYGKGTYVYYGNAGALGTSTNGTSWTSRTSGTSAAIIAVAISETLFTYLTDSTGFLANPNYIAYSSNAISWTVVNIATTYNYPFEPDYASGVSNKYSFLIYAKGVFVIAGGGDHYIYGQPLLAWSTDFINWNMVLSDSSFGHRGVTGLAYGNGMFVYSKASGTQPQTSEMGWSYDGKNWTRYSIPDLNHSIVNFLQEEGVFYAVTGGTAAAVINDFNESLNSSLYNFNTEFYVPSTSSSNVISTSSFSTGGGRLLSYVKAK